MKTLFTALLLLFTINIFAQTGRIKGSVTTADGKPAAQVSIRFERTKRTAVVDENGTFAFVKVPAGTYTLIASYTGLITQKKQVKVIANEEVMVNFVLTENEEQLQEVVVSSSKMHSRQSEMVSKMPLKNLENAQVYNIVSKEMMREQMQVNYQEALNNIPGVVTSTVSGGNGGAYAQMRGFYSTGGFVDGLAAVQNAGTDPINLERIEAIKGPSGTLFGSTASYGGLINRVTKKPYEFLGGEISYSSGTNNLNRLTVDFNSPLNQDKTVLFRINAALHNENSFQDYGYKKNFAVAPSFLFKVNDKLSIFLNSEIYQSNWIGTYYNYSFPSNITKIAQLPIGYKQTLIGEGLESRISTLNHAVRAEYQLAPNWKSITAFSSMQNVWQPSYFYGLSWNSDNLYTRTVGKVSRAAFNTLNIQENVQGEFHIGKLKNKLLFGLDYYDNDNTFSGYPDKDYDILTLPSQAVLPISEAKLDSLYNNEQLDASSFGQRTFSIYASDVINISDRFSAMLSLRMDRFHNKTPINNGVKSENDAYKQTTFSPKFGLVYQALKDRLSVFASYSNGFVNKGAVQQQDGSVSVFKSEQANQIEAGMKIETRDKKLSGSISYFNILVTNKVRFDDVTRLQIQDGSQRHSGVELDLFATPIPGLSINAGYTYLNPKYEKIEAQLQGKLPVTTPKHAANLWASYKFANGIGLAIGGNYAAKSFGNNANTFTLPAYTVINSSVFYEWNNLRLGLKVNNLGNQKYWDINYYPQNLRQFIGNVGYRF
ncbi:TonB-dependent receptor [Pedobacter endophyticus]|uniref:TonB-dependent receptor n=1 Tax=Pedobacter endophyticus TaxID=2789740 RepID=A0A7S9KZZ3_9SPHI|nr:TonB-dependent receptor [Pedobacter endophyticus]QPH39961.1 TonB-dependent receptor [Pedobacter endophyticus]